MGSVKRSQGREQTGQSMSFEELIIAFGARLMLDRSVFNAACCETLSGFPLLTGCLAPHDMSKGKQMHERAKLTEWFRFIECGLDRLCHGGVICSRIS